MRKSVRTMRYLADTLWSYDRSIFFYFAVSCVLGACLPYVGILMPQHIVSGLLTKEDAQYWGLLFGILGIVSIGVGGGVCRQHTSIQRPHQCGTQWLFWETLDRKNAADSIYAVGTAFCSGTVFSCEFFVLE